MIRSIHAIAGGIAFLTIAIFWVSTVYVELLGTKAQIVDIKMAIPYGLIALIPAMAAVGGTGHRLAKGQQCEMLGAKARRMRFIACNGLLVLVPSALFLAWKAQAGALDTAFYTVQSVELVAGALNLVLLGKNARDGLLLTGRFRRRPWSA